MKMMNYFNLNAQNVADNMLASKEKFIRVVDSKDVEDPSMLTTEGLLQYAVMKWMEEHRHVYRDPYTRLIAKRLKEALAYLGHGDAVYGVELSIEREIEEARKAGDTEAVARFEEEEAFWATVNYIMCESKGESAVLAHKLLKGTGCEQDIPRAKEMYLDAFFKRYASLDEGRRSKLKQARDGEFSCPMPEIRRKTIDALLKEDREMLSCVFDEGLACGKIDRVVSVYHLMNYVDQLGA